MIRRGLVALALLLVALTLACQVPPAASGPQEPSSTEPAVPEEARPLVDLAKADLSRRKGIPLEQIKLVSLEEVTWPNGSLGYPKPGMVYIQIVIQGYRLILSDGSQTYEYHTDKDKRLEYGD
ncbi:MAG: hypothetical protein Q8P59_03135 [Dehalococcoidia bacterium]|nr:hypothetical protein [Dehalococcoidia bacterium]